MNRFVKYLLLFVGLLVFVVAAAMGWFYYQVRQSLPVLEGELSIAGLTSSVTVNRDSNGVPTIEGENRLDVARALGFIHAQERFFQMDLLRRRAAGELSELFGPATVEIDMENRLHRFRFRAQRIIERFSSADREFLSVYAEGVNSGLAALKQKQFEYLVLREEPVSWKPEDCLLAIFSMFITLNGRIESREASRGLLRDVLPPELAEFLSPPGTEWDAPVEGEIYGTPQIPVPEIFDLRKDQHEKVPNDGGPINVRFDHKFTLGQYPEAFIAGSNNWAVSGERTAHGLPILANDMHLGISVPNTWFRARLQWPADDGMPHDVTGVTLPGVPAIVVGSNGHIAWGFTNSEGDWIDLILIETHPDNPNLYLTPDGYRSFERHSETIFVKGEEPQSYEIISTIWGPLTDVNHAGSLQAIRWTAHLERSVNLRIIDLEQARDLEEALQIANQSGIPPQNFVCVDSDGNIGWTIIGKIPRRIGYDGNIPTSWADGSRFWDGWLEPKEYPRIINPDTGAIWTANARVVDGEMADRIGNGGLAFGARQGQIRDSLLRLEKAEERDMLAIQLDHRALLLERWRGLLMDLLDKNVVGSGRDRARFRDLIQNSWTGTASIDSTGYLLVRVYRDIAVENIYGWLTAACLHADEDFGFYQLDQWEGPLWKLVTERPFHLLDPRFQSWDEALLSFVDRTIDYFKNQENSKFGEMTWGDRNTAQIRHPVSQALPFLSRWLDMPSSPLPGDVDMPRVQGPRHGASERFAVSPGREDYGYFHMPGGQSGHPLSPYYRAGHDAWEEGRPTPFLPGPTANVLMLLPHE